MAETVIDRAHARMQADVNDQTARLGFYEKLVGSELFLLLESDPSGDQIDPQSFDVEGVSYVLAFDREDRLASFAGPRALFAVLSGRALAELLAPNGLGLGFNLEVAPSSILLPPEVMGWICAHVCAPEEVEAQVEKVFAPKGLPESFVAALDARLAAAAGLAAQAYLVSVRYRGGGSGHLLGFVDALLHAQPALAQSVSQALVFSGIDAASLDVGFFTAQDPMAARLARHGLRFDLPLPERTARSAPGTDPARPPILR